MARRFVSAVVVFCAACETGTTPSPDAGMDPSTPADAMMPRPAEAGPQPDQPPPIAACVEGTYEGTFEGEVAINGIVAPSRGVISLTLTRTGSGEFLEVGDGVLSGSSSDPQLGAGAYPYRARIEGILDCSRERLEARILDGVLTWPLLGDYGFEGDMVGDYVPYEYRFVQGIWNTVQTTRVIGAPGTFEGTWTAAR